MSPAPCPSCEHRGPGRATPGTAVFAILYHSIKPRDRCAEEVRSQCRRSRSKNNYQPAGYIRSSSVIPRRDAGPVSCPVSRATVPRCRLSAGADAVWPVQPVAACAERHCAKDPPSPPHYHCRRRRRRRRATNPPQASHQSPKEAAPLYEARHQLACPSKLSNPFSAFSPCDGWQPALARSGTARRSSFWLRRIADAPSERPERVGEDDEQAAGVRKDRKPKRQAHSRCESDDAYVDAERKAK
eukprot:2759333-Prymnesium_polylepis.1